MDALGCALLLSTMGTRTDTPLCCLKQHLEKVRIHGTHRHSFRQRPAADWRVLLGLLSVPTFQIFEPTRFGFELSSCATPGRYADFKCIGLPVSLVVG